MQKIYLLSLFDICLHQKLLPFKVPGFELSYM